MNTAEEVHGERRQAMAPRSGVRRRRLVDGIRTMEEMSATKLKMNKEKGNKASKSKKMTEDQRLIPRAKPRRRWCGPGSAEKKMLE